MKFTFAIWQVGGISLGIHTRIWFFANAFSKEYFALAFNSFTLYLYQKLPSKFCSNTMCWVFSALLHILHFWALRILDHMEHVIAKGGIEQD